MDRVDRPGRPDRHDLARIGQETVTILRAGHYTAPSGRSVSIAQAVAAARAGTRSYTHEQALAPPLAPAHATRVTVSNQTTLAAVRDLLAAGASACALNFASATRPGGGFDTGAVAQEESLARASGLFACIEGHPMYDFHLEQGDPLYTSWMLHSPSVPVFRDDDGILLEAPYACAMITAAAPNATVALAQDPGRAAELAARLRERVDRLLGVACHAGERHLVLGAWGCGVFGNNPVVVADLFGRALEGEFAGVFEQVVFAVLDRSGDQRTFGPFQRRFATPAVRP
jgi:uncharacterized protein (TIGR02452 family)